MRGEAWDGRVASRLCSTTQIRGHYFMRQAPVADDSLSDRPDDRLQPAKGSHRMAVDRYPGQRGRLVSTAGWRHVGGSRYNVVADRLQPPSRQGMAANAS